MYEFFGALNFFIHRVACMRIAKPTLKDPRIAPVRKYLKMLCHMTMHMKAIAELEK